MSIINDLQSAVSNGADILGEILTWSVGDNDATYTDIQDALHKAGMDVISNLDDAESNEVNFPGMF